MQNSPPSKISFSFAGSTSSPQPISPRREEKILISNIQPVRVSPHQQKMVRTQYSPVRVSPQGERRVIVTHNDPVKVSPHKVVVSHQPMQYSPFTKIESTVNKQQIAKSINQKLDKINSKIQRLTQLQLQNTRLKQDNQKLKRQEGNQQAEKEEIQPIQSQTMRPQNQDEQVQQTIKNELSQKEALITDLQQQNDELKRQLNLYKQRMEKGQSVMQKIMQEEGLLQNSLIIELKEIF